MNKEFHLHTKEGNDPLRSGISPLLQALVLFTKLFHKPYTAEALTAGLPVSPGESYPTLFSKEKSKSLFSRAAQQAGLKSTFVKRSLEEISPLQLPMIILLKGDQACILEAIAPDRSSYKIIFPEAQEMQEWVPSAKLHEEYLGEGYFIKKPFEYTQESSLSENFYDKHWFWDTIKLSKDIYKDVIYATILVNMFVLATPLYTMSVYDRVVPNNAIETLWVFAIGVFIVYLLDTFLKLTRATLLEMAGKKSDIIMSSIIFEKVLNLKMSSHPKSVGSFASNLKDFDSIRAFLTNATLTALVDFPFAILFLCVIGYIGGWVVIVPLVMMAIILGYAFMVRSPLQKSIESTHQASAAKNSILVEALQNIETLKTLGATGQTQWAWEEATGEIASKSLHSRMLSASIPTVTGFLIQITTVIVVVVGVYMIGAHELTMGGLIAITTLASRAVAPMGQAAALVTNYSDAKSAYETLNEILSLPSERPLGEMFITRPDFQGEIEFKDLSFGYEEGQTPALNHLSFSVKSGEKVAIIGRIGSGKSTIAKLLLKLYEPTQGSILIDGIDLRQIDPADVRKNISYVSQDVHLFKGTLKENILFRAAHASDEQMIRAARLAGVDEFVKKHPKGYEMLVGERGMGLSGGQRQSVGIARALLFKTPILILDEPTNAMDQLSESRMMENLKVSMEGTTTLIITQKTSLLPLVDRIIVMHEGGIYLDGARDVVLKKLQGESHA